MRKGQWISNMEDTTATCVPASDEEIVWGMSMVTLTLRADYGD